MPIALRQLMLLQLRGLLRRGTRQVQTGRGALFFGIGVIAAVAWLASIITAARIDRAHPEHVRNVMPLVLLGITLLSTLTSAGEKAIAFTGGEVDFLFPGPFTRRQLLVFKLTKGVFISVLTGTIFSATLFRFTTHWGACYIGAVMALIFVQFAGTAAMLVAQSLGERTRTRGKLLILAILMALILGALGSASGSAGLDAILTDPRDVLQRFSQTVSGMVLLAPFVVLTRVITASSIFPEMLPWVGGAAAINLALALLILLLDKNFVEAAAGASERRYERIRKLRTGGAIAIGIGASAARRSFPMLPRLGGAGTIAWRQLSHAVRASRSLLVVLLVLSLTVGPVAVISARQGESSGMPIFFAIAWMSVLMASVLRFDFRADLDAMDTLKALPIRPIAVATGQLIAPTIVMTLIHWIVMGATLSITAYRRSGPSLAQPIEIAAAVALPFNLLMFAAENLVFLMAPSRPTGSGPGDFSLLGRQLFTLVVRTFGVGVAAAIAATVAIIVHTFAPTGWGILLATLAAFIVLSLEAIAAIPLVAFAYDRFDPSLHMPA